MERVLEHDSWSERDARGVMSQILSAIEYIHRHNIVHRNVRLENFLYDSLEEEAPLRLVDFGNGCVADHAEGFAGTLGCAAPEMLRNGRYGPTVDCFSAGVCMAVLLSGTPPFRAPLEIRKLHAHREALVAGIDFRTEPFCLVTHDAQELLRALLEPNARTRITSLAAAQHCWFAHGQELPGFPLWFPAENPDLHFLLTMGYWYGGLRPSVEFGMSPISEASNKEDFNPFEEVCDGILWPPPEAESASVLHRSFSSRSGLCQFGCGSS